MVASENLSLIRQKSSLPRVHVQCIVVCSHLESIVSVFIATYLLLLACHKYFVPLGGMLLNNSLSVRDLLMAAAIAQTRSI